MKLIKKYVFYTEQKIPGFKLRLISINVIFRKSVSHKYYVNNILINI